MNVLLGGFAVIVLLITILNLMGTYGFLTVFLIICGILGLFSFIVHLISKGDAKKLLEDLYAERKASYHNIASLDDEINKALSTNHSIEECSRCGETSFYATGGSSVGALKLECTSCKKATWSKPNSATIADLYEKIEQRNLLYRNTDWQTEISEDIINERYNGESISLEDPKYLLIISNHKRKESSRDITKRHTIPGEVKREVWRRDQGKCVQCGSNKKLEYDHIIPVVKGGANTVRNIQLLCEPCNRKKSAKIQ